MRITLLLVMGLFVAACTSPAHRDTASAAADGTSGSALGESAGARMSAELPTSSSKVMLRLEFDDAGNWDRIVAPGTAELPHDLDSSAAALDTAYAVATLRAKQALAEFLSSDVRTTRTLRRIARSYGVAHRKEVTEPGLALSDDPVDDSAAAQRSDAQDQPSRQSDRFAAALVERISEQSSAILRGAHVARRAQHDGFVVVELVASQKSINAAAEIARRMRGQR